MSEKNNKASVNRFLNDLDECVNLPYTPMFGGSGFSDRIVCLEGRFIMIEVKDFGKEPRLLQKVAMQKITDAGGLAFSAYTSKDVREVLLKNNFKLRKRTNGKRTTKLSS